MSKPLKLDELRPQLKEFNLYEGDRNLVIEDKKGKSQVVLPKEHQKILHLFDGKNSIKDISSLLYSAHGSVSFHSIITTVKLLNEANLLDNLEHSFQNVREEKAPHEQKASILGRPLYELKLWGRVKLKYHHDSLFFILVALLVSVMGLNYESFLSIDLANFLKTPTGYEEALLRIVVISSVLLSMKAILQGALLLLSAGTFYGPYIRLFPYACALGINDNSLYSHPSRVVIVTYGVISSLLHLVSFSLLSFIPQLQIYDNDLAVMAMLLGLIELNPYRKSDLTKLFYFFYAENQLKSIMPYLKNCTLSGIWKDTGVKMSDEIRYISYSVLALGWAIGFSLFSLEIVLKSFPTLFYQIQLGNPASKYSAMAVICLLLFITGHLLIDLFQTVVQNIFAPLLVPLMKFRIGAKKCKDIEFDQEAVKLNLKQNMLFNQISGEGLACLLKGATLRSMKQGSSLIVQGDDGRDVYFLVKGEVDVSVREKTGRVKHIVVLGANTLIGEMAILEKSKRTANVTALSDIVYLEIPFHAFQSFLSSVEFADDAQKLVKRIEISQFVAAANLFKDFPPEVMNLFVEAGDLVLFPGGHNIVDEGERDKTFYLLLKGKVDIYKGDQRVAALGQGDFFGEVALIANVPRTATVKTVEDSLFLYIEDKKFWKILSENIELAMYIESVGRHRLEEAA